MNKIFLDGRRMDNPAQTHDYLKEALNFADYYGENLDALWDELTSIGRPITVVFLYRAKMLESLGIYGKKLLDTFRQAAKENPHLIFKEKNWRFF